MESGERPDLLRLVDEYRSLLEEIKRCKLSGAQLGGEAGRMREAAGEAPEGGRRLEEVERRIIELRELIYGKRAAIEDLDKRR